MSTLRLFVLVICCLVLLACWGGDTTGPKIVSTVPIDGAVDVPISSTITSTFDEAIDPASLTTDTFTVGDGTGSPFPATVSYLDLVGSLTPVDELPANTGCTVTVAASVFDLAGNPLGENATWSFTTADSAWGGAVTIDTRDDNCDAPDIAAAGDRLAMAVWRQSNGTAESIYACRHTLSGWDSPVLIDGENTDAEGPKVAVNENGDAVAAWIQVVGTNERVVAAVHTTTGGWSTPGAISNDTSNAWYHQVAIDPDGNVIVVWEQDSDIHSNI